MSAPTLTPSPPTGSHDTELLTLEALRVKVLLVEDDEDDYILTRDLLGKARERQFMVDWVSNWRQGLETMLSNRHDVCLVDYRLGAENGIDLLRTALQQGCQSPIILLTGQGEHEIDLEAMKAGAADYLVKGQLKAEMLERSIRYALERKRATALAAFEQARLAAFGADVGLALTRNQSLDEILDRCAGAMVNYLNASLAQIWTYRADPGVLELRGACAPTLSDAETSRKFICPKLDMARIADGNPELIRHLADEPRMPEQDWIAREGLVAYAAIPLLLEGRLVGLMALYSRQPLGETILSEMASVANGIALCIERKLTQAALDASEVKYRTVVENIREVIYRLDENGCWTYLNPAWTELTGFTAAESLGRQFLEFVHPEERERNRTTFEQLVARKAEFSRYETRYLTKDGQCRWAEAFIQLLFDEAGGPVLGATGTLTDITERKESSLQIEKLAAFPRFNPNPVLEFSAEGRLTYANDSAQEVARSLGQVDPLALLPSNASQIVRQCLATGQNKARQEVVLQGHTLSWAFFPIVAHQVVHCYGADITDLLNLEAQFRHAQKLESVGQLAAGIAHDFNNILTVIQGNADLVLAGRPMNDRVEHQVRQISSAAQRATSLTRQLLLFSRKQVMQPKVLDLNGVLRNLNSILPRLLGEDIALEIACAPETPSVEADAGMVEQVLMNLAVNARDAMPRGGRLHLATTEVIVNDAHVKAHRNARPGCYACIIVTDTGCGMSAETLSRLFEPFYTTKAVGKGTGLGLATAYGIVKQHQGWIQVESQLNAGTTFKIFLPASGQPVAAAPEEETAPASPCVGHQETILLVEDEPDLRQMVQAHLADCGYTVLEAANGSQALQVWDANAGRINLVLTDVVMPEGMSGFDLVGKLREHTPDISVIFSSGFSADLACGEQQLGGAVFLPKPYSLQQLSRVVRDCLDRQPVAA
jgi:two-component system, cell cycle sensor histidine kinase and response regulator CckA